MSRESRVASTIWLARHGEAHNPHNVLYGRLPRVRLSPEGERQARALAEYLCPQPLAAIYSSPMLRARRTAEAVLATRADVRRVRVDSDLNEVRTAWEGQPIATLEGIDWDFYTSPRDPVDDSMQSIQTRMLRWVQRVLRRHPQGEVLGVSHGDPILILVGTLSGLPLDSRRIFPRPYIQPGVLYRLRFDVSGDFKDMEFVVPHAEAAA